MSYLKKIEDDYNNGKISLKEINDLRDNYNKKSNEEKSKLDNQYKTDEQSKRFKNEDGVLNEVSNYYYLWLCVCVVFGLLGLFQEGFDNHTGLLLLDIFLSFLVPYFFAYIIASSFLPGLIWLIGSDDFSWNLAFWIALLAGLGQILYGPN